MTSRGLEPEDV